MIRYSALILVTFFMAFYSHSALANTSSTPVFMIQDSFPVITFDVPFTDIGEINADDIVEFDIVFTNTGNKDLLIEVITACKCIDIDWPREYIKPNKKGSIKVVFDSRGLDKGDIKKTIDIIANTNPIVIEAFMQGTIL